MWVHGMNIFFFKFNCLVVIKHRICWRRNFGLWFSWIFTTPYPYYPIFAFHSIITESEPPCSNKDKWINKFSPPVTFSLVKRAWSSYMDLNSAAAEGLTNCITSWSTFKWKRNYLKDKGTLSYTRVLWTSRILYPDLLYSWTANIKHFL